MDFTLALAHFCEVHGPKSVLCTQVLPLDCTTCCRPQQPSRAQNSTDSSTTPNNPSHRPGTAEREEHEQSPLEPSSSEPSTQDRHESTGDKPKQESIEQHDLFRRQDCVEELNKFPYTRVHGETCASCSFTVPSKIAAQLPDGAPGSMAKDGGKPKHGAPVMRSKEFVCLGDAKQRRNNAQAASSQESQVSLSRSMSSVASHSDCHDHTITYLTAKSPDNAEDYAQLRASVIRALSCEVLPRGMSEGPFCFGDANTGFTIAYVFRLTDPKARGRRRAYAFLALAGKDGYTAFKACPMLWEAFATMAQSIEQAAQKAYEEHELHEERDQDVQKPGENLKPSYSEPSSFLTKRPREPNGQPRRANQTQPRSLADIIGNEDIFPILHRQFIKILRRLGSKFGGIPVAACPPGLFQTAADDEGLFKGANSTLRSMDDLANLKIRDDEGADHKKQSQTRQHRQTASVSSSIPTERLTVTNAELTPTAGTTPTQIHRSPQCAPLNIEATRQRQLRV